jgi:hypothetical protein
MIPYRYLILALGVIVLIGGTYYKGYTSGKENVQAKWDADKARQIVQAEKTRIEHQAQIDAISQDFAAIASRERVVTRTIIKEVDRYVPSNSPMLPGDFRLYYNAAVTGKPIDHTSRADAAPVHPRDIATNATFNYAACRYDQERLEALQDIVRTMNGGGDGKEEAD